MRSARSTGWSPRPPRRSRPSRWRSQVAQGPARATARIKDAVPARPIATRSKRQLDARSAPHGRVARRRRIGRRHRRLLRQAQRPDFAPLRLRRRRIAEDKHRCANRDLQPISAAARRRARARPVARPRRPLVRHGAGRPRRRGHQGRAPRPRRRHARLGPARRLDTETAYFNSVNRNKRSVTLDLQTPEGQEIARELAKKSDVLIQNFKFGGIDKLGLGYEQLSKDTARARSTARSRATTAPAPRPRAPATTWWCRARPA